MSTGKLNKINNKNSYDEISEIDYNISEIVIPFSRLFRNYESTDVYSGKEKVPFKKRDPEYKIILMQEFSNIL